MSDIYEIADGTGRIVGTITDKAPHPGEVDSPLLEFVGRKLLEAIGEDPDREGLADTPRRFADLWREFIEYDAGKIDTMFAHESVDQMVCVKGITIWTLCEHHLLPFSCDLSVGYIADGNVLGLSKIGRIAAKHAHKLQIQERLVEDIAREIGELAQTEDVAVIGEGQHLCMTMRGIRMPAKMVTSVMHGRFREETRMRMEFLRMVE